MTGRFRVGCATMCALFLFPAMTQGKSLEEMLVDKGVLTPAELREIEAPSALALNYSPGDGMSLATPDGAYRLAINLLMQARYTHLDYDEERTTVDESANQWQMRRLYLNLKGNAFNKDLGYRLMVDFGSGTTTTLDAYLEYRVASELQGRVGQMTVPFSRQAITPSSAQQFTDRSDATVSFMPFYDIGALLSGDYDKGLVTYAAGVYSGVGSNTLRNRDDNALLGRLEINPLGKLPYAETDVNHVEAPYLSVGGAVYYNTLLKGINPAGSMVLESSTPPYASSNGWLGMNFLKVGFAPIEELEIFEWETDLNGKWRGFSVQTEYYRGRAEGDFSNRRLEAEGFYVQFGYFFVPRRLEVAGRYSFVDPSMEWYRDDKVEKQGIVNWYVKGNTLKVQAEYSEISQQNAEADLDTLDRRYRLQAQLLF